MTREERKAIRQRQGSEARATAELRRVQAETELMAAAERLARFRVTLYLDGDTGSMATPRQVAAALIGIAARLRVNGLGVLCADGTCAETVRDNDGNEVGTYKAYRGGAE